MDREPAYTPEITQDSHCSNPDCHLCGLSYSDLQYMAHKHHGSLVGSNKTAQRRGDFIRAIGYWPTFTAWVRDEWTFTDPRLPRSE